MENNDVYGPNLRASSSTMILGLLEMEEAFFFLLKRKKNRTMII